MSDLIDRQAAIEALFDWEMTYDWDDHCREEDPKPAYIVSPSDVIEQLPSAQPEPRWIPCSERLPNEDEEVLVTSNSGIFIAELSKERDKTIYWFEAVEGKSLHNVTAWMPLPEPYGGESDE